MSELSYSLIAKQDWPHCYRGGRKDLDPVRLSQQSNGLAFSHRHFLPSSPASTLSAKPDRPDRATLSFQKESRLPARERLKLAASIANATEN